MLGRRGEEVAAGYLEAHGMRIVDRNWRCPEGEIDIVALDGETLVIAEVKTRKSLAYGHPFEAVGAEKLARLHRLGASWSREHELRMPLRRVDVVAVLDDGTGAPVLEHLKGVGVEVALGRTYSVALVGLNGYIVEVEADIGQPMSNKRHMLLASYARS